MTSASRAVAWPVLGALLLAGMMAAPHLPLLQRTMGPRPTLTVRIHWPGASALLVERELTAPVERALHGVRGIHTVRSTSEEAVATVTATLDPAVDVAWIRLGVREYLEQLRPTFPEGVSNPEVTQEASGSTVMVPLVMLTLEGPRTSRALQHLLETVVMPRLRALPGVARVTPVGGTSAGLGITIDPQRSRALGLSSAQVAQQLGAAGEVIAIGIDRTVVAERSIRLDDRPESEEALARLPISGPRGAHRPLGELATIRATDESHGRFHRLNGQPVVGLEAEGHPGMDPRPTMVAIRRELAGLRTDLPAGIQLRVVRDGTEGLTRQQNQVAHRFSVSVLAVLVLCLLRWGHVGIAGRALVVTASALGATVLTLVLWGRAVPIASLVVLSLAVGPLAMLAGGDSAGAPRPPFLRLAPWGYRVSAPLLWLAMVLPIGFLTPAVRSRLVPPLVALLALVLWHAACAASVAGVAPVSALARSQRCPRGRGPLALGGVRVLRRTGRLRAGRGMRRLIRRPAWAITLTVAWTVGGFWYGMTALASTPRQADAPDGSTLRLEVTAPRGTDPALVDAVVRPFERLAMADPVAGITRASGAGAEAQVLVEIDPAPPGATAPQRLQARFVARATQVGGMALLVQGTGPAYHAGDDGRGHSAFRLQLAGYQWEPLDSLATALVARLERMPRVRDVRVSSSPWRETPPGREILIQPDRGTMARLGLPIHDMAATVAGDAGGLVGRLTLPIGGDDQPVSVREDGAALRTLTRLGETPVPTSRGLRVRLRDVATFREHTIPMAIEREAQRYVRYVHYEIRGTPRRAQRIQSGLRATLAPPPGFTITDVSAGADPDAEAPFERSWRMGLLGIVLAGLAAAVRSDRRRTAAVVWLVLPSVLAGALIARARFGQSLTPESLAGLVLAGGVAAQLAAARSAGATDRWWVLLGTVASTGPFLMTGGAETPGQLTAAVVLGGIGGSTVALALAGPLVRGRIH